MKVEITNFSGSVFDADSISELRFAKFGFVGSLHSLKLSNFAFYIQKNKKIIFCPTQSNDIPFDSS